MADKKQTQILVINDMAGYGKVALSVMIPVFTFASVLTHSSTASLKASVVYFLA